MSESKIGPVIDHELKIIECLPSKFNNNQFVAAIFLDFIRTIHKMFEIQETLSLYELIEHIYFLIHRRSHSHTVLYNVVYGTRGVSFVSIHDFYKFIRCPLIFYDANDFVNHPLFHFLKNERDINIDYIHVILRFCETVLLFAIHGVDYDYVYTNRFYPDYNQNPYVPLIGNYYNTQEMRNDILSLQTSKSILGYFEYCKIVSDEINQWFTHIFMKQYHSVRKLNSLQYVIQKNSNVHPRIKDALSYSL
jgi:hypothetical protein